MTSDGSVRIDVPAGAVAEDSVLRLTGASVDPSRQSYTAYEFELALTRQSDGSTLTSFSIPAAYTMMVPSGTATALGSRVNDLSLLWFNSQGSYWYAVESLVNAETLTVTSSFEKLGRLELSADPLLVRVANQAVIYPIEGGVLSYVDDLTKVIFTGGDTTERLRATVNLVEPCAQHPSRRHVVREFELTAVAIDRDNAIVTNFAQAVELTVSHSPYEIIALDSNSLALYQLDDSTGAWNQIAAELDPLSGTLTATTNHFSIYSSQGDPNVLMPAEAQYFQVDMHSGSSSASIPIDLPAGPGGLSPQLSLNYSSATVDEMKTNTTMASWVGIGWNLAVPTIFRDPYARSGQGRYYLSMNGASDLLIGENSAIPAGQPNAGRGGIHTKRENYLDITAVKCTLQVSFDVWYEFYVRTKDGTEYQFGTTPGGTSCLNFDVGWSANEPTSLQYFTKYLSGYWHRYVYRADVSRITDTRGNRIDFTYWQDLQYDCVNGVGCMQYVRAAYPTRIQWGANNSTGTGHVYEVLFNKADFDNNDPNVGGWDDLGPLNRVRRDAPVDTVEPICTQPKVMDSRSLNNIQVKTTGGAIIREYSLDYTKIAANQSGAGTGTCPVAGVLKLNWLKAKGRDGTSELRKTDFGYIDLNPHIRFKLLQGDCASKNLNAPPRPYLTSATNGFGGTILYTYAEKWTGVQGRCTWTRNGVATRKLQPAAGQPEQQYLYSYLNGPVDWLPTGGNPEDAEFRGFGSVTEDNLVNGLRICDFHTDDYYVGLPVLCRWLDYPVTQIRSVSSFYSLQPSCTGACSQWDSDSQLRQSKFVSLDRSDEFEAGRATAGTSYLYDGYGNVKDNCEYAGPAPTNPCASGWYRRTVADYAANATKYIVGLPNKTEVKDVNSTVVSSKRFYYDNQSLQTAPVTGNLTTLEELRSGTTDYIATQKYGYDSFGNRTSEKDGLDHETVKDYTACGNTQPASVTAGKTQTFAGHTTTYAYGDCVRGLPEVITDPNGVAHNVRYDVFGRREREWSSGDSQQSPTVQYFYDWDSTAPNGTRVERREQALLGTLWEKQWVDGFGRPIQTRNERSAAATAAVDIAYDAAGNRASQSIPYDSVPAGEAYVSPSSGPGSLAGKTQYLNDFLGRVTRVTDQNGSYRTTTRSGNLTTEIDELRHRTDYRMDAFGRKTEIDEFTGTDPSFTFYAGTDYAYDQMDRLTSVYDAAGTPTIVQYDKLGRKTSLNDPDTGQWAYEYWNDGDLKSQTDPRGVRIEMTYDSLGRMTNKSYAQNGQPISGATAITYEYDVAPSNFPNGASIPQPYYPVGRLTRVVDWAGEHLHNYDARSRETYERHVIGGTEYNVQRAYDSMDRPTALTYPDGEVVSYSYNQQGLNDSLQSSLGAGYLASGGTGFNAAAQPTSLALGNSRVINFGYRTTDFRLNSLSVSPDLLNFSYAYDQKGNIQSTTDQLITQPGVPQTSTFSYDHRDRLTSVTGPQNSTFQYDTIGNLTQKQEGTTQGGARESTSECQNASDDDGDQKINDGCTTSYSTMCYGAPNCSIGRPHAVKTASGTNPNLTSYDSTGSFSPNYAYDAAGNLLEVSAPNDPELGLLLRLEHLGEGYDAEGRVQKVEYNKLDYGTTSPFVFYDLTNDCTISGSDLSAVSGAIGTQAGSPTYNPRYDLNSDGSITSLDQSAIAGRIGQSCPRLVYDAEGNLTKVEGPMPAVYIGGIYETAGGITKYYHTAAGRRIAMRRGGTLYYSANDHLDGTAVVMDSGGALVSRNRYHAYGMGWAQEGTPPTDKLYTGQRRFGPNSGMYYYNARFYGADIGRFTQADAFMPPSPQPEDLNRYSYVYNNPVIYNDPTGLFVGGAIGSENPGLWGWRTLAIFSNGILTPVPTPASPQCGGVVAVGPTVGSGAGWAFEGSTGAIIDFCRNAGYFATGGVGGGASVGGSLGIGVTVTNAANIQATQGTGGKAGACVVIYVGGCLSFVGQKGVGGVSVSLNVGFEVSFHGLITGTEVFEGITPW